jgi:hypothetical protein
VTQIYANTDCCLPLSALASSPTLLVPPLPTPLHPPPLSLSLPLSSLLSHHKAKAELQWGWSAPGLETASLKVFFGGKDADLPKRRVSVLEPAISLSHVPSRASAAVDADPDIALICPIKKVGEFCHLSDGSNVSLWSHKLGVQVNVRAYVTVENHQYVLTLEEKQSGTCKFTAKVSVLQANIFEVYGRKSPRHEKTRRIGGAGDGEGVNGAGGLLRETVDPHIQLQFGTHTKSTKTQRSTCKPRWNQDICFEETHELASDMPSPPLEIGLR